jgi:hypothetical protein
MNNQSKVWAYVLGISLIIASTILGAFFYSSRRPQGTINVVGMASEKFEADMVKWSLSIEEPAALDDVKDGYRRLDKSVDEFMELLESKGIESHEVNVKPVNVRREYDKDGLKGYTLYQSLYVVSSKMEGLEALALNPLEMAERDIMVQDSRLEYFYSKIDDLKKDIISNATVNAKERASKVLENTDVKLGKLLSVRTGVFQITEPYSTEVSSYGIYDTASRKKEISVTVHAVFALK